MWWSWKGWKESLTQKLQQTDVEEWRKPSNMFLLRVHVKMNLWQAFCFAFCPVWTWSCQTFSGAACWFVEAAARKGMVEGATSHWETAWWFAKVVFALAQGGKVSKMLARSYIYKDRYLMLFHPYLGHTVQWIHVGPFRCINYAAAQCWLFMNGWPDMDIRYCFPATSLHVTWWDGGSWMFFAIYLQMSYKIHCCTNILHTQASSPEKST